MVMVGVATNRHSRVKVTAWIKPEEKRKRGRVKRQWKVLNEPQDIMNWLVMLSVGMKRMGYEGDMFNNKVNKYVYQLYKEGMSIQRINSLVIRATDKVRFGFELGRVVRRCK